ncbi:hypothetical protein F3Y22_tig00010533pilonHSYRG00313 [Hibiscus syriacus]|uniref:Uncharacterized protein n=1 Tax=Hibiscus syriacus TaxID=106335 RepID=A0A6A3C5Q2_HIBSY|nr:hypothetical protein F3Y22_tig00010533pilonHSYRG00313 [Hibiscus syriacus]
MVRVPYEWIKLSSSGKKKNGGPVKPHAVPFALRATTPQFSPTSHDSTPGLERASHGKATWDPTQGAKPMFHHPSAPTRVTSSRYKARQ